MVGFGAHSFLSDVRSEQPRLMGIKSGILQDLMEPTDQHWSGTGPGFMPDFMYKNLIVIRESLKSYIIRHLLIQNMLIPYDGCHRV